MIENKDTLDSATWKEARQKFDAWVLHAMRLNPLEPIQGNSMTSKQKVQDHRRLTGNDLSMLTRRPWLGS